MSFFAIYIIADVELAVQYSEISDEGKATIERIMERPPLLKRYPDSIRF